MKTKITKKSLAALAIILAVALSHHYMTAATAACGFGAHARSTLSIGCKVGNWTVLCEGGEGNCRMSDGSDCYVSEAVSGDCGDMCASKPNRYCAYFDPITVVVTGKYGTPTCNEECGGYCANVTPYPPGTTATYYEISEGYCQ